MSNLPTGTVTFLYTDIEGSTKRWEASPDEMKAAVERHDDILRAAIEGHGGVVFRRIGDAFCASFPTAPLALSAAIDAQRALLGESWDDSLGPVRVRMALHTGIGEVRDGDYVGAHLNRIARLLATGYGGQVLLSQATSDLVHDALPEGVRLLDLGEHHLKDLQRPEHVFQLVASGLPEEFPPLKTLDSKPNNLPVQRTPIVGREKEVAAVGELLMRDDVGLLTLTGPGGTGKTRLGLQVTADLAVEFEDGAFMVALAPVDDPELVVSTIVRTLAVPETGGRALLDTLKDYLRPKQLLLFLDNFEQVIGAAPIVAELLAAAPRLKVLVTSREALRVYGEREFSVLPLSLPLESTGRLQAEQLNQYEAVRLFIERATAVKSDFMVNNDNAPSVAEICVRLDGLPLAIELAAARIRLLTPQAMLTRLQGKLQARLQLLTGGARDLPARQQTLRGAIEWSYDLMSPGEQMLFNRLAIFRGGCTLEAAEAVCNHDGDLELDLLDGVESLVSKSLVRQSEGSGGEPRFWMLETIREYGLERLEASGEGDLLRRSHAEYYVRLAEEGEHGVTGPQLIEWFERLEAEHDNFVSVFERAIERGGEGAVAGLRLTGALWHFWHARGYVNEGVRWAEEVLRAEPSGSPLVMARGYMAAGFLNWTLGYRNRGWPYAEKSIALAKEAGDTEYLALVLTTYGGMLASGAAGDDPGRSKLGRAALEQGLALNRQFDDQYKWSIAFSYVIGNLGANLRGDYEGGSALAQDALDIFRRVGDEWGVSQVLNIMGDVARIRGEYAKAQQLYEESLALYRKLGNKMDIPASLHNLAYVAVHQSELGRARALFKESLALQKERGNVFGIIECLRGFASVALAGETLEKAARLFVVATKLRDELDAPVWPAERAEDERTLTLLRSRLDDGAWQMAEKDGRAMTMEQAVSYALEEV